MLHLIKYSILVKIRNFNMVFWPLVFPLLLATLFYFAFGRIDEADFETVPAAIVMETGIQEEDVFLQFLEAVEQKEIIKTETMTKHEAESELQKKTVDGVFYVGKKIRLEVGEKGIPESILQTLLENYENGKQTLQTIEELHPENLRAALQTMQKQADQVQQVSLGGKTTDGTVQFFYALIAMACLYGTFIGLGAALGLQADLMPLAARSCVSPKNKWKMILSETCSSFLLHFINVMILVLYIRYILKQEFTGSLLDMMLVVLPGCIIGVSMGIFIGSTSRLGEGWKTAIMLGISMGCSFFAGLMDGEMKYVIERHVPFLNRLNPAAVITDAFYCINVYDDRSRYYRSLLILGGMAAVLAALSFAKTRRERYDSI